MEAGESGGKASRRVLRVTVCCRHRGAGEAEVYTLRLADMRWDVRDRCRVCRREQVVY